MLKSLIVSLNITNEKSKDSGLALTLIFLILGLFLNSQLFKFAIIPLLVSMTIPNILYPFALIWFSFSHILGNVMSKVILSFVYYLIVSPIGILRSLFQKNLLNLSSFGKSNGSVFHYRNHNFTIDDIKNPF